VFTRWLSVATFRARGKANRAALLPGSPTGLVLSYRNGLFASVQA
jgi:hypothetical protein